MRRSRFRVLHVPVHALIVSLSGFKAKALRCTVQDIGSSSRRREHCRDTPKVGSLPALRSLWIEKVDGSSTCSNDTQTFGVWCLSDVVTTYSNNNTIKIDRGQQSQCSISANTQAETLSLFFIRVGGWNATPDPRSICMPLLFKAAGCNVTQTPNAKRLC